MDITLCGCLAVLCLPASITSFILGHGIGKFAQTQEDKENKEKQIENDNHIRKLIKETMK